MDKGKLLCCDWGTTNFRLYLVDIDSLRIISEVSSGDGIAKMSQNLEKENLSSKMNYYSSYLNHQINQLRKKLSIELSDIPVLLSGMASSSIGLIEVPYATLPFSLASPTLNFKKIKRSGACPHELYIFGGIRSTDDVMRGEEVQVLGLRDVMDSTDGVVILPGTHSKHVRIKDSEVIDFDTYMTGELFELLSQQSILKHSVAPVDSMTHSAEDYFKKGVSDGSKIHLLRSLFKVRSRQILDQVTSDDNYFYLSGLLIGHELTSLTKDRQPIYLGGGSSLTKYYELGLRVLQADNNLVVIPPKIMELSIPKALIFLYHNQVS